MAIVYFAVLLTPTARFHQRRVPWLPPWLPVPKPRSAAAISIQLVAEKQHPDYDGDEYEDRQLLVHVALERHGARAVLPQAVISPVTQQVLALLNDWAAAGWDVAYERRIFGTRLETAVIHWDIGIPPAPAMLFRIPLFHPGKPPYVAYGEQTLFAWMRQPESGG